MLPEGELQKDANNSNFDIFESALNMKSRSMPLTLFASFQLGVKVGCCLEEYYSPIDAKTWFWRDDSKNFLIAT